MFFVPLATEATKKFTPSRLHFPSSGLPVFSDFPSPGISYCAKLNRICVPNRVVARRYEFDTSGSLIVRSKYNCIFSF